MSTWCRAMVCGLCCAVTWPCIDAWAAAARDPLDEVVRELHDPSPAVRQGAAIVFVNRVPDEQSQRRLPALIAAARAERDPSVRAMMVTALGNTGSGREEVVAPLRQHLAHDPDAPVRQAAAESLGRLGLDPVHSVDALVAALHDQAPNVRAAAASALGAKAFDAAPMTAHSVPALASALADPEGEVWSHAVQALRDLGIDAAPALPAVRALMKSGGYRRRLAAEAIAAMARYGEPAEPDCLAALEDPDPETRVEAAIALLAIGRSQPAAFALLSRSLDTPRAGGVDADNQRRAVVVRSAWAIGHYAAGAPPEVVPRLAALASDPSADIARFAEQALERVTAALVTARRGDALDVLQRAHDILLRADEPKRAEALAEGIEALRRLRPWPLGSDVRTSAWTGALVVALAALLAAGLRWRRSRRDRATHAPRVLLSYRRDDSAALCGRIYDRLVRRWGAEPVFRDLDTLEAGDPFAQRIREAIRRCDAVVVLIGPRWAGVQPAGGARRIDAADDFVRQEVGESLAQGKRVIPVLHDGAHMPAVRDLPLDIAPLAGLQAIELTETHFDADMARLERALETAASVA